MNFLLPIFSFGFIFKDNSVLLNNCLGKGFYNTSSNFVQCTESQFGEIFCWAWLGLLSILMSNVIDVFCIVWCFKDINKGTEESRNMLSKQAYRNRKRYHQISYLERSIFQTFWKPHCCAKFLLHAYFQILLKSAKFKQD